MYCESDRHVSPEAFTVHGGLVVPFDKAGPHPLRDLALRARTCATVRQYGEQAAFLKQLYQVELIDVFVAETMNFDAGHGKRTGAVWGEGITTDLPEVDYICFVNNQTRFIVPFPVVVDVVGIQPFAGYFPPRYRVSGWPGPKLMDALRFHALPWRLAASGVARRPVLRSWGRPHPGELFVTDCPGPLSPGCSGFPAARRPVRPDPVGSPGMAGVGPMGRRPHVLRPMAILTGRCR